LRLVISKELDSVGVSLPSSEDGNGSSSRNVEFFSYLEFRTMNKFQNPSDPEIILQFQEKVCISGSESWLYLVIA
jgi:hypothetical protein